MVFRVCAPSFSPALRISIAVQKEADFEESDNDEFTSYQQQYGVQFVNRTDGKLTRSYKRSIFDFVDFFHEFVET